MWQGLSVPGRGDTLHLNSLYHCNKGLFTHKPLHHDRAIKLPTVSSRYGWMFTIFYCLVLHIIQEQKVDNVLRVINFNWCWLFKQKITFETIKVDGFGQQSTTLWNAECDATVGWVTDAAGFSDDKNAAQNGTFTQRVFAGPKKVEAKAALSNIVKDKYRNPLRLSQAAGED